MPNKVLSDNKKVKKLKKKVKRDIAKVLNKNNRVGKRLLGMNPYALTLLDPFNHTGVKIPDENLTPSVAFSIIDRRTITINAQGIGCVCYGYRSTLSAIAVGSLVPIQIASDAGGSYVCGFLNGSAATSADLTLGTLNTTGPQDLKFSQWNATTPTIPTMFDKVRLVSAGLNVQFTGNFTNNSGKYTAAFAPRFYSRNGGGLAIPISAIAQIPGARQVPVSQNSGVTVIYEPLDSKSLEYVQVGYIQQASAPSYTIANALDWDTKLAPAEGGELWVAIDGSVSTTTFQVTFVGNYEGVPSSSSVLLAQMAQTQSHDPLMVAHAMNVADTVPNVVASSAQAQGTATGLNTSIAQGIPASGNDLAYHPAPPASNSGSQSSGGGFMDKILGMISDPSTISNIMSGVEKFTPLIESGLALL